VAPRRPQPTAASKARAERIAAALAGLLLDEPTTPEYTAGGPYRGVELPPKPVAPVGQLVCPNCDGALEIFDERGIEIHRCTSCAGLWLDPGELDDLVSTPPDVPIDVAELREEMRNVAPPVGEVRYRKCPRCRELMNRRNYGTVSGVVIDECNRHGMYLDAREFDAIETFIRMGGMQLQRQKLEEARLSKLARREADAVEAEQRAENAARNYRLRRLFRLF
jgi:Zn-finger nucleic acid-binding protein